jgi:hypothetical protein
LRNGAEEDVVDDGRVLPRQWNEFVWQREDHVRVSHLCSAQHNAEDFKQGARCTEVAAQQGTDGTLLKIPLC